MVSTADKLICSKCGRKTGIPADSVSESSKFTCRECIKASVAERREEEIGVSRCPKCGAALRVQFDPKAERQIEQKVCPDSACGYVKL